MVTAHQLPIYNTYQTSVSIHWLTATLCFSQHQELCYYTKDSSGSITTVSAITCYSSICYTSKLDKDLSTDNSFCFSQHGDYAVMLISVKTLWCWYCGTGSDSGIMPTDQNQTSSYHLTSSFLMLVSFRKWGQLYCDTNDSSDAMILITLCHQWNHSNHVQVTH